MIIFSDTVAIAVSVVLIVLIGAGLYAGLFVYRYDLQVNYNEHDVCWDISFCLFSTDHQLSSVIDY